MGILVFAFIIYSLFVYTSGTCEDKGSSFMNPAAARGKLLFQEHNCISCHQLYGLGGYMGPDLTNVFSRYRDNGAFVKAMLSGGSERMPDFHLSAHDIEDLAGYLKYVDKTGISPIRKFKMNYDGTVTAEAGAE